MRIKVALLDTDKNYLQRITMAFANEYVEKVQVYAYSNAEDAMEAILKNRIDVLLCSSEMDIDHAALPANCGFAYLVRSMDIESYKGKKTVCKFQKIDQIYKTVLDLYANSISDDIQIRYSGDVRPTFYVFTSFSAGAGASTVAAAFARRRAQQGDKVLYINLERFGEADYYFRGDGQYTFGDVLFALKSNNKNIQLKMQGYMRQDDCGVQFFAATDSALDMAEITADDVRKLIGAIREAGSFNTVVIDATFSMDEVFFALADSVENIVVISDGSKISNNKFRRVYNALDILEQQEKCSMLSKIAILYNKFRSKSNKIISGDAIQVLGGIPKIEEASQDQIILHIADNETLDTLLK